MEWTTWGKFASEVAVIQLIKSLTLRRAWNAIQVIISFILSAIFRKNIVWGVPPVLNIEPTNICNLRCPLCATGSSSMNRPRGHLDFKVFKRFIDELADRSLYVILYHQGEPYLNKQFIHFVAYAKQKKLSVTTSTNGHFFDVATAEATVRSGLDSIIISVDGVTQSTYAHYRVGGSLEKVLNGIRTLVSAKKRLKSKTPYIFLQFLVMQHNEHELPEMEHLAHGLGIDRLLKKTAQVHSFNQARQWLPGDEHYRRYRLEGQQIRVKSGGKGACPRPWLTTLLDWDSRIAPCCFDKNTRYSPGILTHTERFQQIWHSEKYNRFRHTLLMSRHTIDICKNCSEGIGVFR